MGHAELTNDEAQYALYGYYLDWSYFDHPPLSGWLNAAMLRISDSDFALRVWPVVLAALTSFLLYGFTRELFPNESVWVSPIAVLIYQSSIISQVFGLGMLPDTPLIPIAISAAWVLYRTLNEDRQYLWIYVGLLFGLAGLAKYTAVTLIFTAIISLFIFKRYNVLFTKWAWSAIALAVIVISPVLYWNMQHDWISIAYQLNHGSPHNTWQFKNLFISQATQLITYGPIVYLFGLGAIYSSFKSSQNNEKYILAFALPVLVLFGWNSGYEPTLPHWTALGWIALAPITAKWVVQYWHHTSIKIITCVGIVYSFVMTLALHLLLSTSILPFEDNKHLLEDIYGWKKVAHRAVELKQQMNIEHPEKEPVIFVGNWSQFSRLAWYARPTKVQVTDLRYGQSDMWYGSAQAGSNGILVVPPKYKDSYASGLGGFEECQLEENVAQTLNDKIAATYQIFKCYNYKGSK